MGAVLSPFTSGGTPITITPPTYITTGDIPLSSDTGGQWLIATEADAVTLVEIDIAAAVGNFVEIDLNGMRIGTAQVDVAVVVGTTQVRYMATGTNVPAGDGDTGWYDSGGSFALHGGGRGFVVTANDLDGDTVRFCIVYKSTGTGAINATADNTFYWQAKNYGTLP